MSRWFRHYAGLARDDKLVRVSIRANQPVERAVWLWCAILESAAEIDDDGRYELEPAEIARFLRVPVSKINALLAVLTETGRIDEERVCRWSNRQFKSDRSAERVAAHRAKKGAKKGDTVTLQERHRNAPETETETDTPLAKANGGFDPEKEFWDSARAYLKPRIKRDPGSVIGGWLRDRGKPMTIAALNAAQLERAFDPIAYCEGYFRRHAMAAAGPEVPL